MTVNTIIYIGKGKTREDGVNLANQRGISLDDCSITSDRDYLKSWNYINVLVLGSISVLTSCILNAMEHNRGCIIERL